VVVLAEGLPHPADADEAHAGRLGLRAEDVELTAFDGTTLRGWFSRGALTGPGAPTAATGSTERTRVAG
jgi:hypothetical protein